MITQTFDELQVGQTIWSRGRTVTETDVVSFCYLTGNWLELHSNKEFAAQTEWGQRLVQGSLVFALIPGLFPMGADVVAAFYGVERIRFLKPVFIGDTVRVACTVDEKQDRDDRTGVVNLKMAVYNQQDEVVQVSTFRLLVRKHRLTAGAVDR